MEISSILAFSLGFAGAVLAVIVAMRFLGNRAPVAPDAEAAALEAERLRRLDLLASSQSELAGQLKAMTEASTRTQAELARSLNERLDAMSKRMGDSLTQNTEKTGETLAALQARIAVLDEAQKSLAELSQQVVGLQDILGNKQARGAFGETRLENIVQDALPASLYEFQSTLSNRSRADCLVRLPNPPGPIVIDSKFPLEGWRALHDAKTDAERIAASRAFAADVQKHITDIADKYIITGETAESALMFIPSEAVFASLHADFANVVEQAQRRRVWIVSPTTLWAVLATVRAVMKDVRMREQAHVIQREVGRMSEDVERLRERTDNLKKHFVQVEKDIREIDVSAEKIKRQSDRINELQIDDAAAPAVTAASPAAGNPSPRLI